MPELTITEFLLTRIAENEALAQSVEETHSALQSVETDTPLNPDAPQWAIDMRTFVNRWDPARVLAECEAKRRIVELETDSDGGYPDGFYDAQYQVMQLLAAIDADHPDFDESWRP